MSSDEELATPKNDQLIKDHPKTSLFDENNYFSSTRPTDTAEKHQDKTLGFVDDKLIEKNDLFKEKGKDTKSIVEGSKKPLKKISLFDDDDDLLKEEEDIFLCKKYR